MDDQAFDVLVKALSRSGPRRSVLRAFCSGALAVLAGRFLVAGNAEAKKRRKKKRCKGNTRRCGKQCIPLEACCNGGDCGQQEACIGGKCAVPCGPACDAIGGFCATSVSGAEVCVGASVVEILCAAAPCLADSECAATEICFAADCPAVGGVTNRCLGLRLP